MELLRIWTGMLTQNRINAGTNSKIFLNVKTGGIERLNDDISRTTQPDQERSEANLFGLPVGGKNILAEDLENDSISCIISGSDAWQPEHLLIWGEGATSADIIPLAIETEITTKLSTSASEGQDRMSIRLIGKGDSDMSINRLLVIPLTRHIRSRSGSSGPPIRGFGDRGTDSPFEIQISNNENESVVFFEIRDTSQTDLNDGHANFYFVPVTQSFTKKSLGEDAITISIKGLDPWLPESFFIFGLDTRRGRPENIVPLVHLTYWPYGFMKADAATGIASVTLPILPDTCENEEDISSRINELISGQNEILRRLR